LDVGSFVYNESKNLCGFQQRSKGRTKGNLSYS
jgi:hypothetical protein